MGEFRRLFPWIEAKAYQRRKHAERSLLAVRIDPREEKVVEFSRETRN